MASFKSVAERALIPFKGRLTRRVALVVFAAIIVVETIILIPSVRNFERDRLHALTEAGRTAIISGVAVSRDLFAVNPGLFKTGVVTGVAIHNVDGTVRSTSGEPPVNTPETLSGHVDGVYAGPTGHDESRFEVLISLPVTLHTEAVSVVARLDSSAVAHEANAFIIRIIGLVLLISFCVCGTTVIMLNTVILGPLLNIRDSLDKARQDPEHAEKYAIENRGNQEVAEVSDAINELFGAVAQTYREEIGLLATMVDRSAAAALVYDGQGDLTYANEACIAICGAKSFEDLRSVNGPRFACSKTGDQIILPSYVEDNVHCEAELVTPDGRLIDVLMTAGRLTNERGETLRWHATMHDISLLKQRESQLEALVVEVEEARDRALDASRAKSVFLASMSHELRTPLNAIIGYSELIHEDAKDLGHTEFLDDLERILKAANHLLGLITSVLDLSKIEAGKMDVFTENFDLAASVSDAVTLTQPIADKHGNVLKVDCSPGIGTMTTDKTKVGQILINLLGNACKYTQNGNVNLKVHRAGFGDKAKVVFEVSDTGPGIEEQKIKTLFQPFSQIDYARSLSYGSSGLGLVISKLFCKALGGDIEVDSQIGVGSTFTVTLPVACPTELHTVKQVVPVY